MSVAVVAVVDAPTLEANRSCLAGTVATDADDDDDVAVDSGKLYDAEEEDAAVAAANRWFRRFNAAALTARKLVGTSSRMRHSKAATGTGPLGRTSTV